MPENVVAPRSVELPLPETDVTSADVEVLATEVSRKVNEPL